MIPPNSWLVPGKKSRNIHESDERDVETIAEPDKTGAFDGGIDIEHPGQECRLVGHDAYGFPAKAGKTDDDILGIMRHHLEEIMVIHHSGDDVPSCRKACWDRAGTMVCSFSSCRMISSVQGCDGRIFHVVGWQEAHQFADHHQRLLVIFGAKWATPLLVLWVMAPPRSSLVTSSWVTVLITSGPVTNI